MRGRNAGRSGCTPRFHPSYKSITPASCGGGVGSAVGLSGVHAHAGSGWAEEGRRPSERQRISSTSPLQTNGPRERRGWTRRCFPMQEVFVGWLERERSDHRARQIAPKTQGSFDAWPRPVSQQCATVKQCGWQVQTVGGLEGSRGERQKGGWREGLTKGTPNHAVTMCVVRPMQCVSRKE